MSRRTLAPTGRRPAEVLANEAMGAYRLIRIVDRDGPADPRPGQFYMLATRAGWGGVAGGRPYVPRAFSYARVRRSAGGNGGVAGPAGRPDPASSSRGPELHFLLDAVGPGTERLGAVEPGEEMWIVGPLGVGFSPPLGGPGSAILVGGGIGVAPILCWHDELGSRARLLLGFRSSAHAATAGLFGGEAALVTDDGSTGRQGLVTDLLREELHGEARRGAGDGAPGPPGAASPTVYACGPPPMLEAVRRICAERGIPAELALESGMACGFGACFGCVVPTRSGYVRLCLDGPVLDAAALESAEEVGVT